MKDFVKRMVEEHSQLVVRTTKLHNYVYSDTSNADDKIEFANKCIQLAAMKKYEEALRARLENQNVVYDNGEYFEKVASINEPPMTQKGNDFDEDKETEGK